MWFNGNINVNTQEISLKGGIMKVKLKSGEKLSSNQNYCGLALDNWIALNQGKVVELDVVPKLITDKVEEVKTASNKKGGK